MKLTIKAIKRIITRFEPRTVKEFAKFGLTLKHIGSGGYRKAYEIVGYGLIIKIPITGDENLGYDQSDADHSRTEWNAYRKIKLRAKYKKLKPYLPKIYLCSNEGIILMKKYSRSEYAPYKKEFQQIKKTFRSFIKSKSYDIKWYNIRVNSKGKLKIIDLGRFSEEL